MYQFAPPLKRFWMFADVTKTSLNLSQAIVFFIKHDSDSYSVFYKGFLLDFISYPVIKGFTCAAAVIIGFGQVKVSLMRRLI